MNSLSRVYRDSLQFSPQQVAALTAVSQYLGKQELFTQQTPETLESLKEISMIESVESSNRIEGVFAPHARIQGIVLKSTTPRDRSEQEIAGYRDALDLIHQSGKQMEFSTNVLLQLHATVFRYLRSKAGEWKNLNNEIVEKSQDGSIRRIIFSPTNTAETPAAIQQLCESYGEIALEGVSEPLVTVPLAILDFLCIHPFQDGNGRVARLLTLMLLYQHGYEVGRYISLERIFEESKETYYEALEASSDRWHQGKHIAMPWLNYFWGVMLRAYREFEERVGSIRTRKGSKTDQIRNAVERKIIPFSISEIERDCPGVSRDLIRKVLRQLKADGFIESTGKGRYAKWKKRNPRSTQNRADL